ncbi:MAG: 2Fe-2S iron-sulfur cluster-binding protein, partial [Candidatus Omnitrophota bacterium]
MITLNINDKEVRVEQGKTVLEAALQAGIYVPNLCYHPDIPPIGACRLCIVEIGGIKGFPTSCTTEVKEGMIVRTDTPRLQELRKKVMWFILSELPSELDGSSQLKKVAEWIGVKEELPGYVPQTRNLPVISDEPLFIRDLDRCILCGRCFRMCQEVREIGVIGLVKRGIDTIVGTHYNVSFKDAACKFCEACVEVCPSGALTDKEKFEEKDREKVLLPCTNNCPAGIEVARYVRLIAEGRYQDALEVVREKVPFPHVLGCVCDHPCEEPCRRGEVNEPIAIRALKRFVAELDSGRWRSKIRVAADTNKRVAVVGAGPAGLTASWFLRILGHSVTVFEALPEPGGMMRTCIPKYRLPRDIVDNEIRDIEKTGVKIKTNEKVESVDKLFDQGFDAVFLATGADQGMKMGMPGEDDPRVLDGISVLKSINLEGKADITGDVAVIGGGNVAMDVARNALR